MRGVRLSAVQKAIASGRIKKETRGGKAGIDPETAGPDWDASTDPSQQRKEQPTPNVASRVFAESRAAKESFAAKMAKLEYEMKSGTLAQVDKVKLGAFQSGRIVRDYLSGMSARIAGKLAAETDPVKIQIILDAEINKSLIELARQGREKTGVIDPETAGPDAG